jgi:hypothetical protein
MTDDTLNRALRKAVQSHLAVDIGVATRHRLDRQWIEVPEKQVTLPRLPTPTTLPPGYRPKEQVYQWFELSRKSNGDYIVTPYRLEFETMKSIETR